MGRKVKCAYCTDRKCGCGGVRRLASAPRGGQDGEVRVKCDKCGATWLHFHRAGRGTAKEI